MKTTVIWIGALVVGAILGLLGLGWLDEVMNFVATVYTRLFQLLAVPTIVLAVITTFATFGSKGSGRIFGHTLTYTLLTTIAAAAVGAILYVLIAPSNLPAGTALECCGAAAAQGPDVTYSDHVLSIIPNNIVKPFLEGNVLSLLLLAFAIGIGLSKLPDSENKSVIVKGLLGLQELLFLLIRWLIWTLPLGIVAFSAQLSAQVSAGVVADSIGKYVLVVLGGNVIQFFVILPLFLLARGLNPIHVLGRMMPAVLMALFTKSSAATLPVTSSHTACDDGYRRESSGGQEEYRPFCAAHLHHDQYERLCSLYPRHLTLRDAEWRYTAHHIHHLAVDTHLRHLCRRQCRCAHGLLFPHPLADVGHWRSRRHPGCHSAHLYDYRYGGNGRECMVGFVRSGDGRSRFIAKYHVCGMRITCPRYCGNVKNAVPLRCDYITSRVQAAPQQFEHARLHSACTVLAPKEGYYIINFIKG